MRYQTVVESDGKTVYITTGHASRRRGEWAWTVLNLLLLLWVLGAVCWNLLQERSGGLLLWLLLIRFLACPAFRRMGLRLVKEEVELDTRAISSRRVYGFIPGRRSTLFFENGGLATGADPLDKAGAQLQVSWFMERPEKGAPKLLYRHWLPMTTTDYEKAKAYLQELFDLEDDSGEYELLFSAN